MQTGERPTVRPAVLKKVTCYFFWGIVPLMALRSETKIPTDSLPMWDRFSVALELDNMAPN